MRVMLARRLRESVVAVDIANDLMDKLVAENEGHELALSVEELEYLQRLYDKVGELVGGYEDRLHKGG